MQQQLRRWHIYSTIEQLEAYAARAILRAGTQAIQSSGRFTLVIAGGNTPRPIYERLVRAHADWTNWHVYFCDERCVPVGDPARNDRMARDAWLQRVAIPPAQIRSIPAEQGAQEGARRYAEMISPIERFDFVLLGVGEDGHVASLFPGQASGNTDVVPVLDSPKPPVERVSLSAARLSRAQQVMFVASGESKREAVRAWRRGDALPAAAIQPPAGVDILLDVTAWPDPFV